jgi:hypothetical protein
VVSSAVVAAMELRAFVIGHRATEIGDPEFVRVPRDSALYFET